MMTLGPLIHQKTWPCIITWQSQHTHLAVSAAIVAQVSAVIWSSVSGRVVCTLMGHSLPGLQQEQVVMKNFVDSWQLEAMVV